MEGGFFDWSTVSAWDVTFALLSVVAGWIASRLVRRGTLTLLGRVEGVAAETRRRIARVAGLVVLLLGIGVALSFLGAPLQPVLAIVIIVGVIAVLVLRGIADNFSAGIVLQTRKPVQPGDHVATADHDGVVEELEVTTPLGGLDVEAVLVELERVAAVVDGVRTEPAEHAPWARPITIGSGRVTARVQVWHEPGRSQSVGAAVVRELDAALSGRGPDVLVTSELPTSMTRTEER